MYAASVIESISGVMKTMQRWKMYCGSSLSIAVGEIISRKRVCMACLWLGWHLIWIAGAIDC